MADTRIEVIAVGEPGCYVAKGHLNLRDTFAMLQQVCRQYDEDIEDLDAPRHTWVVVKSKWDEDFLGFDETYREVFVPKDGAEPYTLIPCSGEWPAAPSRKDTDHA